MGIKTFFILSLLCCFCQLSAQVNCDTILPPPSESEYVLPYPVGRTFQIIQANCPNFGGHANTFAYDFDTQMGDTILASRAGLVIWANDQYADDDHTNGHENNVFIFHNDETVVRYTHLQQNGALVSPNSTVAQGQPIGLSGKSGNTGGVPHLHMQLFRNGTSYDKDNALPFNFANTNDPVDGQNLLINGQAYTALGDTPVDVLDQNGMRSGLSISPNPSNGFVKIGITSKISGEAKLDIFDMYGRTVQTIFNGYLPAGQHSFPWNSNTIDEYHPHGLYFVRWEQNGSVLVKKLLLK